MTVRLVLIAIAAVLLAIEVIRDAAVRELSMFRPAEAARVWSGHPSVETSLAMTQIAQAAHAHRAIAPSAFAMMDDVAAKAPLAPEPFLVRGVEAELGGNTQEAQRAFEAAQRRDPRSLPAAYFLAKRYLLIGDAKRGLGQLAALARLAPQGNLVVAPYLALYARKSANWPALRSLFRANPELAEPALIELAGNIATAPAVLALADPAEKARDAHWLGPLLNTLTSAGKYGDAHALWGRLTGANTSALLYDAAFRDTLSPAPFNWLLTSSTVGVAERQAGRLHVVFYGQEDGILASELLLLQPGQYHLSMQLLGDQSRSHSLTWSIWCDKSDLPIASVNLDVAAQKGWTFAVPANCPAQSLRLSGTSLDIAQQVDVMLTSLKLEKVNSGA